MENIVKNELRVNVQWSNNVNRPRWIMNAEYPLFIIQITKKSAFRVRRRVKIYDTKRKLLPQYFWTPVASSTVIICTNELVKLITHLSTLSTRFFLSSDEMECIGSISNAVYHMMCWNRYVFFFSFKIIWKYLL